MSSSTTTVTVSDECVACLPHRIDICYQTFGDPDAAPLLLVMGLGGPMTWWDDELCEALADRGFHVIRYDNRDTGHSTRCEGRVGIGTLTKAFLGREVRAPYTMDDLAADAFALLDHLGIEAAHVAGASMGGMIAQTMAIAHPERVLSLTSIMSTTGRRTVGWQHPALLPALLAQRGPSRDAYIKGSTQVWRMIGSPGFPHTPEELEKRAGDTFDRGVSRAGVTRQMLAVLTQPDRTRQLRELRVPTLVIHGLADKMVHVSGGRSTAMAVQGSELLLVPGMGHDFPKEHFDTIADGVRRTADRSK